MLYSSCRGGGGRGAGRRGGFGAVVTLMAVSDAAAGEARRDSSGACCMRIKFVQLSSQLYNTVVVQLSTRGVRVLYTVTE